MLYLNIKTFFSLTFNLNLTLTNVVFEYRRICRQNRENNYLTLTNVVFEFWAMNIYVVWSNRFNFNKCCIWIRLAKIALARLHNLTLTNVVFEFICLCCRCYSF